MLLHQDTIRLLVDEELRKLEALCHVSEFKALLDRLRRSTSTVHAARSRLLRQLLLRQRKRRLQTYDAHCLSSSTAEKKVGIVMPVNHFLC